MGHPQFFQHLLGSEAQAQQDQVQDHDDGDRQPAEKPGRCPVGELAHHVTASTEDEQRYQREGQSEAEHYLGEDENPKRVQTCSDDGDRRDHGNCATQEDGEFDVEEALNDDLPGHHSNC